MADGAVSDALFRHQFGEMFKGAVVGFFRIFGKEASRQLPFLQMVSHAVATDAFAAARIIRAAAHFQIFIFFAFHGIKRL